MRRIALLVVIAALLLLVAPPPSPIHLSYVTSDSMAPTLETGDGYLIVDAGSPTTGDIVVFDAESRAGYTTHRVVGVTDEGYLTKGDANPSVDQEADEAPVTENQILGTVVTVGGRPLTVPFVGSVASAVDAQGALLAAVGLLGIGIIGRRTKSLPDRPTARVSSVLGPLTMLLVLAALVSLTVAPTTHSVTYVASDTDTEAPAAVPVGEAATVELEVEVERSPLAYTVYEADGATVTDAERGADRAMLTVELPARDATGAFSVDITAVSYPRTLPVATIEALHAVHPVAARIATIAAAFLPLGLLFWLFVDGRSLLRAPLVRRVALWGERP